MACLRFKTMELKFFLRHLNANGDNFVWCGPCGCDANVMCTRHVMKWLDHMSIGKIWLWTKVYIIFCTIQYYTMPYWILVERVSWTIRKGTKLNLFPKQDGRKQWRISYWALPHLKDPHESGNPHVPLQGAVGSPLPQEWEWASQLGGWN